MSRHKEFRKLLTVHSTKFGYCCRQTITVEDSQIRITRNKRRIKKNQESLTRILVERWVMPDERCKHSICAMILWGMTWELYKFEYMAQDHTLLLLRRPCCEYAIITCISLRVYVSTGSYLLLSRNMATNDARQFCEGINMYTRRI